jgi:hypothetical protein
VTTAKRKQQTNAVLGWSYAFAQQHLSLQTVDGERHFLKTLYVTRCYRKP